MPENLLTIEEVADYFHVGRNTIYRLLAQKRLPAFKVGNQWRFQRKMLESWLRKNSNIQKEWTH